ncbi:11048_t:CDS:2 [Acaulospora morrowiae]|uniref:Signal peptidase complex subunit 1 n=1 Tax=Acaulospora morrowiae TaxID=94023 RepID=A0A9N9GJ90_9GLOM|nr:11048_t:CDS:2 [Acaulospora morrowiae]
MYNWLECKFDFEGQRLAESISQISITSFATLGFLLGFLLQDLQITAIIFLAGIAVTALIVLPSWSIYNKNPVQWLPEIPVDKKSE